MEYNLILLEIEDDLKFSENRREQAGAELCQAQVKLGLAKGGVIFHLPKKLRLSSIYLKVEVVFHLPKKLRSPSVCLNG